MLLRLLFLIFFWTQEHEAQVINNSSLEAFYDGCGTTKLCFGDSTNCVSSGNCKAAVAVTVTETTYDFELTAVSSAGWVGVGLSDDNKMGDDSVIECTKSADNVVLAYMSWTSASPKASTRLTNPQLGIQLLNGSVVDSVMYCNVRRNVTTDVNGVTFDLANDQYYLLIAAGASFTEASVDYHDVAYAASADKRFLTDVSSVSSASKILLRLHGCFMLAAWIGTASIGTLLARYYRKTWVGRSLGGKDLWFAWHQIFMILTWVLTLLAFILIFVEIKAWTDASSNPHPILGLLTTILCFFQPIGAIFRPHPGTPRRPIFNWAHRLAGNGAHLLGIITIFFAVTLTKAELPEFVYWILAVYVVVHIVAHIILTVLDYKSKEVSKSYQVKDHEDEPYSNYRRYLLAAYILVVLGLMVTLIAISAAAPIQ